MKQKISISIFLLGIFLCGSNVSLAEESLSQKEIADLAKPAVVRIVQKIKGKAKVPEIEVDFKTLTVKLRAKEEGVPSEVELEVDDYLSGSGVVVHPDGYILTNSHVVSYQSIKNLIVSDFIYTALQEGASSLNEEDVKQYVVSRSEEEIQDFSEKVSDFILEKSVFELEKNLVVLNPALKKEKFEDLVEKSFPASLISVNDNFYKDDRDSALVKIEEKNLPTVSLGEASTVSVGKKVYIYGYPSTATLNLKDNLEPTFTQGTVSATKDSQKKDFKIFQTDAKISSGSSGGPLLDESGRVVGLVTFITNEVFKQEGDSFAFALPVNVSSSIVRESVLGENEIPEFQSGEYENNFRQGVNLLKSNRCSEALKLFSKAKEEINKNFSQEIVIDEYIKQCEAKIEAGESLDSTLAIFFNKLKSVSRWVWILILALLAAIAGLGAAWFWLLHRVRKDERELDNVEEFLDLNLEDGTPKDEETGGDGNNRMLNNDKNEGVGEGAEDKINSHETTDSAYLDQNTNVSMDSKPSEEDFLKNLKP